MIDGKMTFVEWLQYMRFLENLRNNPVWSTPNLVPMMPVDRFKYGRKFATDRTHKLKIHEQTHKENWN